MSVSRPAGTDSQTGQGELRDAALAASAAAQIVLDAEGRLAMSNDRANDLFELSTRDVGRPFADLDLAHRPVELRTPIAEAVGLGRTLWQRNVRHVRGDDVRSLDVQVIPLLDDSCADLGTTVLFHDVTEQRELHTALAHANRQLEAAYGELRSNNEELETTIGELQSTTGELERSATALLQCQGELERLNRFMASALDIGLPGEQLEQPLRLHVPDVGTASTTVVVDAVDGRGESVRVRVTVSDPDDDGEGRPAAMLVMDALDTTAEG